MDLGLKGKSVIVTAASKGLGKATAKQFAAEGAHVLIASRTEETLLKTRDEIRFETGNEHIDYAVCDVTNPESIKDMVAKAAELHGTVDVLVNNAGGPPTGTFQDMEDADWQHAFELNLLSFIRNIREVLPYMQKQKHGHIANIASSSIKQPLDNLILSNTFRAGILGLSKSLSQELGRDNILINTIGPGRIATARVVHLDKANAEARNECVDKVRKQAEKMIPMGRYGEPEEFAKIVVYLCSQANTYVTGQALLVDGGMVKAF